MALDFSLTDSQRKAFDDLLLGKESISSEVKKQDEKYDAFKALLGPERILNDIKNILPLSFRGQALVNCDSSNTKDIIVALARFVSLSGATPVLVLMNFNYRTIQECLKENSFNSDLILIDTVTKSIAQVSDTNDLIFIDSLRNLTQLQIKLLNVIEKKKNLSVIFDSLAILELYHNDEVVSKFIYSLTKLLHKKNVSGFYVSTKKDSSKLSQFFDETVALKKYI